MFFAKAVVEEKLPKLSTASRTTRDLDTMKTRQKFVLKASAEELLDMI